MYICKKSKDAHQPVHPLSLVSSILHTAWIILYKFTCLYMHIFHRLWLASVAQIYMSRLVCVLLNRNLINVNALVQCYKLYTASSLQINWFYLATACSRAM